MVAAPLSSGFSVKTEISAENRALLAIPGVVGYGRASAQTPLEANADETVKRLGSSSLDR